MDCNSSTIPLSVLKPTTIFATFVRCDWHHQFRVLNRWKLSSCRWLEGLIRTFSSVNFRSLRLAVEKSTAVLLSMPSISAPNRILVFSNFVVNIQHNSSASITGVLVIGSVVGESVKKHRIKQPTCYTKSAHTTHKKLFKFEAIGTNFLGHFSLRLSHRLLFVSLTFAQINISFPFRCQQRPSVSKLIRRTHQHS